MPGGLISLVVYMGHPGGGYFFIWLFYDNLLCEACESYAIKLFKLVCIFLFYILCVHLLLQPGIGDRRRVFFRITSRELDLLQVPDAKPIALSCSYFFVQEIIV